MAEEAGDKTEAPTPRRRQEAREQGNVARSQDLTAAVLLIGTMMLLHYTGGSLVAALKTLMAETLSAASLGDVSLQSPVQMFIRISTAVAIAMAPLMGGVVLLAIAVNLAQVGFNVNTKKL